MMKRPFWFGTGVAAGVAARSGPSSGSAGRWRGSRRTTSPTRPCARSAIVCARRSTRAARSGTAGRPSCGPSWIDGRWSRCRPRSGRHRVVVTRPGGFVTRPEGAKAPVVCPDGHEPAPGRFHRVLRQPRPRGGPVGQPDPARPDGPVHDRRDGPVQAVLRRRRDRAVATGDVGTEVLPDARHRPRRDDDAALHLLRDARQLQFRRLLQGRGDPVRVGASSPMCWGWMPTGCG